MLHFGIIGKPLHHSFSAMYFNEKFEREGIDAEYSLYPLDDISAFPALLQQIAFKGLNVTMPYKQAVIPYLHAMDEMAAAIGAVNVIKVAGDGRLTGYNSDAIGFMESVQPLLHPSDHQALILGTGGAAKAARYGLEKLGLHVTNASRTPQNGMVAYDSLCLNEYDVIVNCTPLGMTPNTNAKPAIPYEQLQPRHLVYDCIYNPEQTLFLQEAAQRRCRTCNGMPMLLGQARAAWNIWNS